MEVFFSWVGAAFGALFVAAVAVAWWEHLVRTSRSPAPPEPLPSRAVSVDVQLDTLTAVEAAPAVPSHANDAAERRATLDGAMSRMARAGQDGSAWIETSPMVLHSATETPPADSPPVERNTSTSAAAPQAATASTPTTARG